MEWRKIMDEHFHPYTQYPHNPQNTGSRDSFTDITDNTHKGEKLKSLDEEERFIFEERAAIMEFDGGLSREQAEEEARQRVK